MELEGPGQDVCQGVDVVKTPDAVQLATAKTAGAAWFSTNDGNLSSVPGISILVLDRLQAP